MLQSASLDMFSYAHLWEFLKDILKEVKLLVIKSAYFQFYKMCHFFPSKVDVPIYIPTPSL